MLLAALLSVLVLQAAGKITHAVVDTDDRKLVPLTDAFGFADGGKIDIQIKDIALWVWQAQETAPARLNGPASSCLAPEA